MKKIEYVVIELIQIDSLDAMATVRVNTKTSFLGMFKKEDTSTIKVFRNTIDWKLEESGEFVPPRLNSMLKARAAIMEMEKKK